MKEKSVRGKIPIYGMTLEIVVTDDIIKSQLKKKRFNRLGKQKPMASAGISIYCDWNFCLILDRRYIDHNLIAHECFHVTHRIADYCGVKFAINYHEEFAYLNGFINSLVYQQLREWKIKVKS